MPFSQIIPPSPSPTESIRLFYTMTMTKWALSQGCKDSSISRVYFFGLQNHCRWWLQLWNEKMLTPWEKSYDQPRQLLKSRDVTLPTKFCLVKAMVFPVVTYGCESWTIKKVKNWALKNWCFWTMVLEKTLESSLDYEEIQPVHPKGNSPEYSLEELMLKQKLQYWRPDEKSWLIWKDFDAGKDWRREEKGKTENEMVECHHWLNGHEFE